jgi:hypothetical protein
VVARIITGELCIAAQMKKLRCNLDCLHHYRN